MDTSIPAEQSQIADAAAPQTRVDLWSIIHPVRSQIRFAMALSIASAALGLGAMGGLAFTVHQLLEDPGAWPWPAMAADAAATSGSSGSSRICPSAAPPAWPRSAKRAERPPVSTLDGSPFGTGAALAAD